MMFAAGLTAAELSRILSRRGTRFRLWPRRRVEMFSSRLRPPYAKKTFSSPASRLFPVVRLGNLKHLPFFELGETWSTYEPRFEEALSWLQVSSCGFRAPTVEKDRRCPYISSPFTPPGHFVSGIFTNGVGLHRYIECRGTDYPHLRVSQVCGPPNFRTI